MITIFFLGRIIFGAYFVYSGIMHFKNEKGMITYAKSKNIPYTRIAVLATGVMMIIGGAGVFLNLMVKQSGILLLLFLIPATFIMHTFWKGEHGEQKTNDLNAFLKNLALIGALLMLIAK